jgi:hypothetical protein
MLSQGDKEQKGHPDSGKIFTRVLAVATGGIQNGHGPGKLFWYLVVVRDDQIEPEFGRAVGLSVSGNSAIDGYRQSCPFAGAGF